MSDNRYVFSMTLRDEKNEMEIQVEAGEGFTKLAARLPLLRFAESLSKSGAIDVLEDKDLALLRDLLLIEGYDEVRLTKRAAVAH